MMLWSSCTTQYTGAPVHDNQWEVEYASYIAGNNSQFHASTMSISLNQTVVQHVPQSLVPFLLLP